MDLVTYADYERRVNSLLKSIAEDLSVTYEPEARIGTDHYDGIILTPDGKRRVLVEIKGSRVARRWTEAFLWRYHITTNAIGNVPALVITPEVPYGAEVQDAVDFHISWFTYNGRPGQRDGLKALIADLLARPIDKLQGP
jgi:hypothetical protein